jgi:pyrroloquinoline-quinone synthase
MNVFPVDPLAADVTTADVTTADVTTAEAMRSFEVIAQMHPLWTHPFLARCGNADLTLSEVRVLAVQMYKFSKEFNRILASILAACSDEAAQFVIVENLFDEMGQGDRDLVHPELFRRFTRAIGISDAELVAMPTQPETQAMIDTYLGLSQEYGYLSALGAVCFASEGIVNALYTQIYHGIRDSGPIDPADLRFFDVHIHVDDSHAANLANLIEPRLQSTAQVVDIQRAIAAAMDARVQFFDGILRSIATLEPPVQTFAMAV